MKRKLTMMAILLLFTMGFRIFPGANSWNISRGDPKLFLQFCSRPSIGNTDLPSGDPLSGQSVTFDTIVQSVINDFNNVPSSYIVLADSAIDAEFAIKGNRRTIEICFANMLNGGEAQLKTEGGSVVSCKINLMERIRENAQSTIHTLTHEIGHCLGLDHPQETTGSVMSYFGSHLRLQDDDKMGLVHLYPTEPGYGEETPTIGMSCSPQ